MGERFPSHLNNCCLIETRVGKIIPSDAGFCSLVLAGQRGWGGQERSWRPRAQSPEPAFCTSFVPCGLEKRAQQAGLGRETKQTGRDGCLEGRAPSLSPCGSSKRGRSETRRIRVRREKKEPGTRRLQLPRAQASVHSSGGLAGRSRAGYYSGSRQATLQNRRVNWWPGPPRSIGKAARVQLPPEMTKTGFPACREPAEEAPQLGAAFLEAPRDTRAPFSGHLVLPTEAASLLRGRLPHCL